MNKLNNEAILARLNTVFSGAILHSEEPYGLLTVEVSTEKIHEIIKELKNDEILKMSFLTLLGAVHYPDQKGRELCVNYTVHSLINNVRLRIRVFLPIENPSIPTITDIYVGADWLERETYDFFGVNFVGHPNLTRILNMDEMDYFPLRKEYHLEDQTREDKDNRFFGR